MAPPIGHLPAAPEAAGFAASKAHGQARALGRLGELESLIASAGPAYLVGSGTWPREGLAADQDYVTASAPDELAPMLARRMGGRAVLMDAERRHWRVVAPRLPVVDLAPMAGGDISRDLALRDFTINAIAAMLPSRRPVLDPFRGLPDFRYGLIRQVSSQALSADPLRVLRGLRLVSEHGFVIEAKTLQAMCRAAPGLGGVKPERIRAEVLRALEAPGWKGVAMEALRLRVWTALPIRPPLDPSAPRLAAFLQQLSSLEPLVRQAARRLSGVLGLSDDRARAVAVLAALFRASDREVRDARPGETLRLSAREADALVSVAATSQTVPGLDPACRGRVYDLVEQHGAAAAWGAGLAGARAVLEAMLELRLPEVAQLPDGRQLAAALARPPGPWLGPLIARLRRAVATGQIRPSEAIGVAAEWIEDNTAQGSASNEE